MEQLDWRVESTVESWDLFQCSHRGTSHIYPVRLPAEDLSMLASEETYAAHDRNLTHSFHSQSIDLRWMTPAVEKFIVK